MYINYQDSDGYTRDARLKKSLYGLKQAPREWHLQVVEKLKTIGFKKAKGDSCLWIKKEKGRPVVFILVHVDDFLILYEKEKWKDMIVEKFKDEWEINIETDGDWLGIKLSKDVERRF